MDTKCGKIGETLSGIPEGIKEKVTSVLDPSRSRFPDQIAKSFLKEVKNVANQALTSQIIDYLEITKRKSINFYLIARGTIEGEVIAKLSSPFQELIYESRIF